MNKCKGIARRITGGHTATLHSAQIRQSRTSYVHKTLGVIGGSRYE